MCTSAANAIYAQCNAVEVLAQAYYTCCVQVGSIDHNNMPELTIEKTVTLSGGELKHRITVPAKFLQEDDDRLFMHLSTQPPYMQQLVGRRMGNERVMSRTNVIEQLMKLRNDKISQLLGASPGMVSAHIENKPKRIKTETKIEIPSTIVIDAPTIGDATSVSMTILMSWKKTAPLFVELDTVAIAYIIKACRWQLSNGAVKRDVATKKIKSTGADDNDAHENIEEETNDDCVEEETDEIEEEAVETQSSDGADMHGGGGIDDRAPCESASAGIVLNSTSRRVDVTPIDALSRSSCGELVGNAHVGKSISGGSTLFHFFKPKSQ